MGGGLERAVGAVRRAMIIAGDAQILIGVAISHLLVGLLIVSGDRE